MKCPQCKKELPPGAAYCHGCGSRIPAKPTEEETPKPAELDVKDPEAADADKPTTPENPRKRRRAGRTALRVFGVLLLLAAIATPTGLAISFWQDAEWYRAKGDEERRDFARREKEIRENALADLYHWFPDADLNEDGTIRRIRSVFGHKLNEIATPTEGYSFLCVGHPGEWSIYGHLSPDNRVTQIQINTLILERENIRRPERVFQNMVARFETLFGKRGRDISRTEREWSIQGTEGNLAVSVEVDYGSISRVNIYIQRENKN